MIQPDDNTIDLQDRANLHEQQTVPPSKSSAELASILDGYLVELQAGKAPDRAQLLAAHPELASQLEACLAGIEFVHRATGTAAEEPASLGEFRIIRELGRGGMGVVYEAEQTSLHRHVALKVLRFGVGADEEATQRFRREAEIVARLHHTNIVPIFAVGSERGVHYYAMQLIEGRSMADVLIESQQSGMPLVVDNVTRWGLQAAEALAHAHQRGVIHRDIKPSNLLIDNEGGVWLTDFGLARHADEVSMTASGALMGTPRYMSPEQAESLHRTIDHRTDLYSLGASLYELATGRPVFASATAHGVVMQILTEEPKRPRQIRPDVPRDFETIILTCLAKDPARRYQTTQALVDDLRAVLEGRPIQARRVPVFERITRYVHKRKKALGRGALVVAGTAVFIVGSLLGWRFYSDWRLGQMVLSTDGPPLTAQILSESGEEQVGEPFAIGTRTVQSLPADEYLLRVDGPGLMGRTYRFGVERGDSRSYRISLDENRLLGQDSIPYAPVSAALVVSGGKADFVEWTGQTLIRRDGLAGSVVWDASRPAKPWDPKRDPVAWIRRLSYLGDEKRPGTLVQPAPDLDGDGTFDIIWAFRGTPSFLALSGKDGSMLWSYTANVDDHGGPDPHGPSWPQTVEQVPRAGRVLGPVSMMDVDGDGVRDLIASVALFEDGPPVLLPPTPELQVIRRNSPQLGRRIILAVSGRSGIPIWHHPIDPKTTTLPIDPFDTGATVLNGRGIPIVSFVSGTQWNRLNARSGQPLSAPIDLGLVPVRPALFADLDGDSSQDILALGSSPNAKSQVLAAFSFASGKLLWQEPIHIPYDYPNPRLKMEWPLVADLNNDGRAEVVIPTTGSLTTTYDYQGVRLLDGATGQTRWVRPLRPHTDTHDGLAHLIMGPDLDQDGTNDFVAVSRYNGRHPFTRIVGAPVEPHRIFVDAISGKDGHSLWFWSLKVRESFSIPSLLIWPPFWWGRGKDGWPMLTIPLGGELERDRDQMEPGDRLELPRVYHLSATSGHELHMMNGLSWPRVADLDGDGLLDLWGSVEGKLRAYHAEIPEMWRALGRYRKAGDLDGDGIADVITGDLRLRTNIDEESSRKGTAIARSGRDGRVLWRRPLDYQSTWFELDDKSEAGYSLSTFPLPGGDLDGDGTADIFVTKNRASGKFLGGAATVPLETLNGRSGMPLWSAGPLPLGFEATGYSEILRFDLRACESRTPADIIVRHQSTFAPSGSVPRGMIHEQNRLARISGRDGHVIWDQTLVERKGKAIANVPNLPYAFGDLDGDGSLDLVVLVQVDSPNGLSFEHHAISLRDGKTLWSREAQFHPNPTPTLAVGDLNGDGRAEVVIRDQVLDVAQADFVVTVLDGLDGSTRWTWKGGGFADSINKNPHDICLVDINGEGGREVCVNVRVSLRQQRIVILDSAGKERGGRDLKVVSDSTLTRVDLSGDGGDELLFSEQGHLHAVDRNLKDVWSWPTRESVREIIPAQKGEPAVIVLDSMIGLDGATGRPRWAGQRSSTELDRYDPNLPPRLFSESVDSTVCRVAQSTTPEGTFQAAEGSSFNKTTSQDDPRWIRRLPWTETSPGNWAIIGFALSGLAFLNIIFPLGILRRATRKRIGSVRILIALPVAVAAPLTAFVIFRTVVTPDFVDSWPFMLEWIAATLAGLPVLEYVGLIGKCLFQGHWKRLVCLLGLTAFTSVVVGTFWYRLASPGISSIEHYDWSGWYMVAAPGAFAVGTFALMAGAVRAVLPLLTRLCQCRVLPSSLSGGTR